MAEETPNPNPTPTPAATGDNSAIEERLREAHAEIAKLQQSSAAQEQRIRAVFQPEEGKNEKLLQALLTTPDKLFGEVANLAENRAYERMAAELEKEKEKTAAEATRTRELQTAVNKLFNDRPDIHANEGARQLFDKFYITTNPNLSETERVTQAAQSLDLALEKIDGKKAEERVNAARSVRGSSTVTGDATAPKASAEERRVDAVKDYMKSREERYKKVFGRSIPGSGL